MKSIRVLAATWVAWESYAFETRGAARKAMGDHKRICWTETRIRKYTRLETK